MLGIDIKHNLLTDEWEVSLIDGDRPLSRMHAKTEEEAYSVMHDYAMNHPDAVLL